MLGPLETQIQSDLVAALKNREDVKLSVLRMLKSSIQVASTEKGREGDLSDEDVRVLIRRAVKQREEAAEQYRNAKVPERAAEELEEAEILKTYLPAQMEDGELEAIIRKIIHETGATSPRDMGKVMGRAMNETDGRADGKRVKDAVLKLLNS